MTNMPEPAHGCTIDGQPAMPVLVAEYNQLVADLAALRAVARGYCPACGRGDAAPTVTDWERQRQRADRAEAALARIAAIADQHPAGIDTALIHEALDQHRPAATEATGFRPFTPAHIPKGDPMDNPLVVEPYRNDRHENVWVFRCWGTDTCDGWLSLDHASEQSAQRARDRHVAEEHQKQPGPA